MEFFGGIVVSAFIVFIASKVGFVKIGDFRDENQSSGGGSGGGGGGNSDVPQERK